MTLAQLIRTSHGSLEVFQYDTYIDSFALFSRRLQEVLGAGTALDPQALMDELEELDAGLPRRQRNENRYLDKQILALFLTPAALQLGGETEDLARLLCEQWCLRYPKEKYGIGTYETILKGFDANLLGLPLRKTSKKGSLRK